MDWNNVDLNSPSESGSDLMEAYTFDQLLLEIACNVKDINALTVRQQAVASIRHRYDEAMGILQANLANIVAAARQERAKP